VEDHELLSEASAERRFNYIKGLPTSTRNAIAVIATGRGAYDGVTCDVLMVIGETRNLTKPHNENRSKRNALIVYKEPHNNRSV